jgi:hypothetical protein
MNDDHRSVKFSREKSCRGEGSLAPGASPRRPARP